MLATTTSPRWRTGCWGIIQQRCNEPISFLISRWTSVPLNHQDFIQPGDLHFSMYSGLSAGPGTRCTSDPNLPTVAQEAFHELHLRILPQIVGDGLESSSPACRLSSCRFQHHLYGTLDLFLLVLVVASVHKLLVLNGIGCTLSTERQNPQISASAK